MKNADFQPDPPRILLIGYPDCILWIPGIRVDKEYKPG